MSIDPYAGNLDFWEKAAATHGVAEDSEHYKFDKILAGGTLMTPTEQRAVAAATGGTDDDPLAGVRGLDVLYLQSHLGADGVVMARAGARMTCADFSATALRRARELAEQVGVEIETVETDSRAIPESLYGRFDLVYVTVGAICWIDDLDRWMQQVSLALRPGGRFVFATGPMPRPNEPWFWMSHGFNAVMRMRNALLRPQFIMYYNTFTWPEVRPLLERHGLSVEARTGICPAPYERAAIVVATKGAR